MTVYLYEEDSGAEVEFEAADIVAAQAHGESLLRASLDRQLAAIQRSGRKVDFPVEVVGHVTEQTGEYNSWADRDPGVTVKFTATAAGFPIGEEATRGTEIVTECINCGWNASTGLSHDEHVRANGVMSFLCYRRGESVYDIAEIFPPRPKNADPVTDDNGTVIGYTARSLCLTSTSAPPSVSGYRRPRRRGCARTPKRRTSRSARRSGWQSGY